MVRPNSNASDSLQGYVLHKRPYRETSYLVDFFTRETGKVSAVVKGVNTQKNHKKSLLQLFQPLNISVSGRSDLKTLTMIEPLENRRELTAQYLFCGLYLNEILNRCLQADDPAEPLFLQYQQTIADLSKDQPPEPILRHFEWQLLLFLGIAPDLTHCIQGQPVQPDQHYQFIREQGMQLSSATDKVKSYQGQTLLDIMQQDWHLQSLKAAKTLFRLALLPVLGNKPLKSRELFNRY
jgi:DNA repair protein RecO (recombination protein O)